MSNDNWTPPGNRSNQHIMRWYTMLGHTTRFSTLHKPVVCKARFTHYIGETVTGEIATSRFTKEIVTGRIIARYDNPGQNEYHIEQVDGVKVFITEKSIQTIQSLQEKIDNE